MSDEEPAASTWHGFPRVLPRPTANAVSDALRRIWLNQGGSEDYEARPGLTGWFDATARGPRLREQLAELDAPQIFSERDHESGIPSMVGPPFTVDVGSARRLVTPEGLGLLRVLDAACLDPAATISLAWQLTDSADDLALNFYRAETTKRLQSVVRLQQGEGSPMLPASVALVVLLLINGNTVPGRGLARPPEEGLEEVDRALVDIARAFVDALGFPSKSVSDGAFSLYSGYALTEARRRLGADLAADPVGIAEGARQRVVERLGQELARRAPLTEDAVRAAVGALGSAYDRRRPILAAYGVANGIPGQDRMLAEDLVAAFEAARNGSGRG